MAGALNTGIDHLARLYPVPSEVFVAFLDDDDSWMTGHLAAVEGRLREGAEVVATTFERLEDIGPARSVTPPEVPTAALFQEGNPGVQGSNLIVRLDLLLEAGGFNEALRSCTDRDLMLRLLRRPNLQYAITKSPSLRHHATNKYDRLSQPGSAAKTEGLEVFTRLHGPLMTSPIRAAHLARAERLFGWVPGATPTAPDVCVAHPIPTDCQTPHLVIGIIVDDRRIASAGHLLADISAHVIAEGLSPPDILVLENRPKFVDPAPMADLVERHRASLRIHHIDHETLLSLATEGGISIGAGRASVADARTVLQGCLYHLALKRPGCIVWILDDDMRLDPLVAGPEGSRSLPLALGESLRRMKATGAAVCIGPYTGAPPLPAVASVRGQLVDLMWNLRRLASLPPDDRLPDAVRHNAWLRTNRHDYYYDLSRSQTDRLETPFALEAASPDETCAQALDRLSHMIPRILAGEAPLRPLLVDPFEMTSFVHRRALQRGGNTFILDPEALADLPNEAPLVRGRRTRRSDMMWCLLQERRCKRQVISVPVPVRQDRTDLPVPEKLDLDLIADDIRGYAIATALSENWGDPVAVATACAKFEQERLAALHLTFHRVRGIARELEGWCRSGALPDVLTVRLSEQARKLRDMFQDHHFRKVEEAVRDLGATEVGNFLEGMEARIAAHSSWVHGSTQIPDLLMQQRADTARVAVAAAIGTNGALRYLGQGGEGVVFTDGRHRWKLFDRWTDTQAAAAVPVLQRFVANDIQGAALKTPLSLRQTPVGWLLQMHDEVTEPWPGGHGPGLVALLADLHRAGLACRNLHPKNLRVVGETVRLIDFGADLVPLDDAKAEGVEFLRMCRRAWLCWRWFWRSDLDDLMRQSIHTDDLAELSGYEGLVRAVQEVLCLHKEPDPLLERALALGPTRILDYGAGKGKEAAALARSGASVVAWDPDPAVANRLSALSELGVLRTETAEAAVTAGPYDLVICRRVACLLEDEALDQLLGDLRRAAAPNGRVLLALCHPAYAHRVRTAESTPISVPSDDCPAHWCKRVNATGRILKEVLRSESSLRRRLGRAGLRVIGRAERQCIDLDRFEMVSDLLVIELEVAPIPKTALLIKACAMDAEALEPHVCDMLAVFEKQSAILETVLTLDNRQSGFLRPHAKGDLDALRAAAIRLLDAGLIDSVVEAPRDPDQLRALNLLWFGLDVAATHSVGGAATAALLTGFEACSARRVLHADLDMMIGVSDPSVDVLTELSAVLDSDLEAVTASFPVAGTEPRPWTSENDGLPWRVESRLGLVDMTRMERLLPLPNFDEGGAPQLSWHRALDRKVAIGAAKSVRGGGGAFCVHPPNARKSDIAAWEEVRMSIARGRVPPVQRNQVEWTGTLAEWRGPERHERFVFVICGRNVPPERFRRCWDSVLRQNSSNWGAIVVDDASEPWIGDEVAHLLAPFADRVTYLRRRRRGGLLACTAHAIRHVCAHGDQVIVTLDADDHLIGTDVLSRLAIAYDQGADLTVGSMLRTDKATVYPVKFNDLQANRGGNVWQHLRSFRKSLFDAVPEDLLKLDGDYVELASDWAFMLPMVDRAVQPHWIRENLYLHEPGEVRNSERAAEREAIIARLVARLMKDGEKS